MLSREEYENIAPSEQIISQIWKNTTRHGLIIPCKSIPTGYVLGGQPGAGKSILTNIILNENSNTISINGDEYRSWHPFFPDIQEKYKKESSKITAKFAGKVTEALIKKAIKEKYNIIIEGTFRTSETPLKTLKNLKNNGYRTVVYIKTCSANISWNRCLARYEDALKDKSGQERFTDKSHHDLVVGCLSKNADIVFQSGLVDKFEVVGDNGNIIFDSSKNNSNLMPSIVIIKELSIQD